MAGIPPRRISKWLNDFNFHHHMFTNNFKIALRNLLKYKGFSAINIIGLAMGIGCFILITMYVLDELSYDRYNEKADRIFRVNSSIRFGGTDLNMAVCSDPMGATLKKDYPQVEEFTRLYTSEGAKLIKKNAEFVIEDRVVYVDSTFFNVFTLPALVGDPKTGLHEPNTVVITESSAIKYFGGIQNALGKSVEVNDNGGTLYKVTSVIKDFPRQSHFHFDFFFSMDNVEYNFGSFLSHNFHTYIVLQPGVNYHDFNKNFYQVINSYVMPQASQFLAVKSKEDFEKAGNRLEYALMPVTDIHLNSALGVELGTNSSIVYVYIFSAVALFILLIACINFMNLATARSANRAREVGIRKVLGTAKNALIGQFLTESIVMAMLALFLAIALAWLMLPWFNNLSAKDLHISIFFQPKYLTFILLLPVVVGIISGGYPAFYLSAFQPVGVLKGKLPVGFKKSHLRSFLVVFQFAISLVLIIGTIIIYSQLNFIQNTKIGFEKDQVLVVSNSGMPRESRITLKNEISGFQGITSASFAGYLPISNSSRSDNVWSTESKINENNGFNMQNWSIDYDYIPTLGMELLSGRNFSSAYGSDSSALIINETVAKVIGKANPIGEKLYSSDLAGNPLAYTIIGVIKNFNYESLRKNVGPLCLRLGNNSWESAYRIQTNDIKNLLARIENKYKAIAPSMPFSYKFLDEAFDEMYREEQRVGKVALTFAVLAIIIACLGLFGLVAFMAEQRTKEIGVRKVLGASVPNLMSMLSKDFLRLIVIALFFAIPFGWWLMNTWLQDFAFRITISWKVFAISGVIGLFIALLTVSSQAIKAALANPVTSLRTE